LLLRRFTTPSCVRNLFLIAPKKDFSSNCNSPIQIVKAFSKLRAAGRQAAQHAATSNYHDVEAARNAACNNPVKIAGGEVSHEINVVSSQNSRTLFRRGMAARRDLIAF
jgi:hypothetical protein